MGYVDVAHVSVILPDGRVLAKHSGPLQPADADRLLQAAAGAR